MTDAFLTLDTIAPQFGVSVEHLRKIATAQHGGLRRKSGKARFSQATLLSYPRFIQGPGRRWGCFQSVLDDYWTSLHKKNVAAVIPFRARRVV